MLSNMVTITATTDNTNTTMRIVITINTLSTRIISIKLVRVF